MPEYSGKEEGVLQGGKQSLLSLHLLSHNLCWYNMDGSRVCTKKTHFALSNIKCMASRQNKFVPKDKVSFMHPAGKEEGLSYRHPSTAFISFSLSLSLYNNLLTLLPVLVIQHQSLPPLPPCLSPLSSPPQKPTHMSTTPYSHHPTPVPPSSSSPPPAFSSFLLSTIT